jgi:hypothetical protein
MRSLALLVALTACGAAPPDVPDAPPEPDAVTCECSAVIPATCVPVGCGWPGSGTHVAGDTCVASYDARVCTLGITADERCAVTAGVVAAALLAVYAESCGPPSCAITVTCAAGATGIVDGCGEECAPVPLERADDGNWNWMAATHVPSSLRYGCNFADPPRGPTPMVCRR